MSPPPDLSRRQQTTVAQLRVLARVHVRVLKARLLGTFVKSKLMGFTLAGFLLSYLLLGYVLFYHGLNHLANLPAIGHILSERIFYMMFFFFFLMLVFSNAVISYTTLFRSRETEWLMTLPVTHRALFLWKLIETLVISSWGLVFLSAPLLAAYGQLQGVGALYYVKSLLAYVPFVVLPAALASWILLLVVRYMNRWGLVGVAVLFALWVANSVFGFYQQNRDVTAEGISVVVTVNQVLDHTRLSVHPLVPSEWMSNVLLNWGRGFEGRGWFFFLLSTSYALMGLVLTYGVAAWCFYPAWNTSIRRRANAAWARGERARRRRRGRRSLRPPFLERSTWALVCKDARTFWREPAQWAQFVVVFGLLAIYILNLRNMGYDYDNPFWSTVVTLLNLGVCSLALSTLTTRFVFPQFSLEGRRLWILGLAPFGLGKVLVQKLVMCGVATGAVTVTLIVASGVMLRLPPWEVVLYAGVIATMTVGLSGLAIGLGTLFPNFRETNPAKIVSGFGGTLCLIVSFIYILLCVAALTLPAAVKMAEEGKLVEFDYRLSLVAALAVLVVVTVGVAVVPMAIALRRVKKLENLGDL